MSAQPSPSAAQAIVSVAAIAAGAVAALLVKPDDLIDKTLHHSARAYMTLCYTADDSARGNPSRGFFGRSVRGVSKWVDESALALSWKVRVLDFDEHSPIKSTTLVTALVALTAMAVTKKAVNIAMR